MIIDPAVLFFQSSEPLRRLVECTDDVREIKLCLLRFADSLDTMRALMRSSGSPSESDAVADATLPPLRVLDDVVREQSG